jgi:hypothetical protein
MKHTLLLASLCLVLAACEKENRFDCFTSMGPVETELRALPPFTEVHAYHRIDIVYRRDTAYRAEVRFGRNVVHHIATDVRDGALYIDNNARCNWVRSLKVVPQVVLYAPTLRYFANRNSGSLHFADTLIANKLTYEEWQANGTKNLLVQADTAQIYKHTGSSLLTARGLATRAELYNASTGPLYAEDLKSPITNSRSNSIQPLHVYASVYLFAILSGRGDIRYAGNPAQIDKVVQGTGRIAPL